MINALVFMLMLSLFLNFHQAVKIKQAQELLMQSFKTDIFSMKEIVVKAWLTLQK